MDVLSPPSKMTPPLPPASLIDPTELRSILSNLSHELCRPLTNLRMGFDLLLTDADRQISTDQRGHVQTMVVLCDELLRLTRSYLDYAGLVQKTSPLAFGSFTVSSLIREIDLEFAPLAAARKIHWKCLLESPDANVVTDPSHFQQIFAQLASNALKYTPESRTVRISAHVADDRWTVNVADDGPGIPAEHQQRVFEPFFKLPGNEPSRIDGNGLGLAICREMVSQLGGDIALDSILGQGTRVTVSLPIEPPPPS